MTGNTLKLKNVRLAFTQNLFMPASWKNEAGKPKKYQCKILIAKDHPQIGEVKAEIERLAKEEWKDKYAQVLMSIKDNKQNMAFLDGDKQLFEGFAGNYSINLSRREKDGPPAYLRANPGTKDNPNKATEQELYSGSFVVAHLSFWTWSKNGFSMNANLLGLQVYRPGEAFSGTAPASALEEFGNEESPENSLVGAASGADLFS